jgi:hypothetical protein
MRYARVVLQSSNDERVGGNKKSKEGQKEQK